MFGKQGGGLGGGVLYAALCRDSFVELKQISPLVRGTVRVAHTAVNLKMEDCSNGLTVIICSFCDTNACPLRYTPMQLDT